MQGVGFRNYVEHVAGKLGVDGFVRNRRDGGVEVFAMGTPEKLKQLRFVLEKGPMLARVTDVYEEPDHPDDKYRGDFIIETSI